MIKAAIIADSVSAHTNQRITTFELEYPRFIHSELMTHRCIIGDTKLSFDLPSAKSKSKTRIYTLTVKEFFDRWYKGGLARLPSRLKKRDLSKIDPNTLYSAKELAFLLGFKSPSNIRTDCRKGNIVSQNPNKDKNQDWLILGSDYLEFESRERAYPQTLQHRLKQMNLRCLDENTNTLSHTNITDIWEVGIKDTYTLTAGDLSITATDDHLILTNKGWKELKDIQVGSDSIIHLAMGKLNLANPLRLKKIKHRWVSKFNAEILPKISEQQNNLCHTCKQHKKLEIHHIVPVHENPDLAFEESNVIAVCNHCHKHIHHKKQGWQTGNPLVGKPILVDSIKYTGKQTVYDLSVSSEQHNFVANGIVIHNCFSRNASSSRAIPIDKMIEQVQYNPAIPVHWGANQSGMQAKNEQANINECTDAWLSARRDAVYNARKLQELGLHKQIVNRVLEPFQMMKTLVTATSFDNFFNLRCHRDAQPEIKELADKMYQAMQESEPEVLQAGEWHTPYVQHERIRGDLIYIIDGKIASNDEAIKVSCSCSAQVSYRKNDTSIEKALAIYDKLVNSEPVHASAFEHCATPIDVEKEFNGGLSDEVSHGITGIIFGNNNQGNTMISGNFTNWVQYRQLIPNHDCKNYRK